MRPKVLVVEDDDAVLETIQLMLMNEFNVLIARNGAEAIRLFEFAKPEVVLLDILLPDIDGVKVAEEILKRDQNAIIIGITAYARRRGKDLLNSGAKEVLEKPFGKTLLLDTIKKYLKKDR